MRVPLLRTLVVTSAVAGLLGMSAFTPATASPTLPNPGPETADDRRPEPVSASVLEEVAAKGMYIVGMSDQPVTAYAGGVKGLKATKPSKGEKINPNSPAVVAYSGHLTAKHDAALAKTGGKKLYSYVYSFNGFAAKLNAKQAAEMRKTKGVLAVTPSTVYELDTSSTPNFLGLTAPGGLYEKLGGVGSSGEDVIIGIVDSGVWPENPAYSDRTGSNGNGTQGGKLSYRQVPGWHGRCVNGEQFTAAFCNQKLIGPGSTTRASAATPASTPICRSSSTRRATTTGMARTPPRPRVAMPMCPRPARRQCSARSAASPRVPDRLLQGVLVGARNGGLLHWCGSAGRDRPGGGRRCGRHQLFDQRDPDQLP